VPELDLEPVDLGDEDLDRLAGGRHLRPAVAAQRFTPVAQRLELLLLHASSLLPRAATQP
jgi:hypothetical protein